MKATLQRCWGILESLCMFSCLTICPLICRTLLLSGFFLSSVVIPT